MNVKLSRRCVHLSFAQLVHIFYGGHVKTSAGIPKFALSHSPDHQRSDLFYRITRVKFVFQSVEICIQKIILLYIIGNDIMRILLDYNFKVLIL